MNRYHITTITRDNSNYQINVYHRFVETPLTKKQLLRKHYLKNDWNLKDWAQCARQRSADVDVQQKLSPKKLFQTLWKNKATRDRINYRISGDDEDFLIIIDDVSDEEFKTEADGKGYMITTVKRNFNSLLFVRTHPFVLECDPLIILQSFVPISWNVKEWAVAERKRCSYDFEDDGPLTDQQLFDTLWNDPQTRNHINYATVDDCERIIVFQEIQGQEFPVYEKLE